eukprot:1094889-Pelagomonas_calceolata.AAC.2
MVEATSQRACKNMYTIAAIGMTAPWWTPVEVGNDEARNRANWPSSHPLFGMRAQGMTAPW